MTAVRIPTNYGQNEDTVDFLLRQWRWSIKDTHLRDRIFDVVFTKVRSPANMDYRSVQQVDTNYSNINQHSFIPRRLQSTEYNNYI